MKTNQREDKEQVFFTLNPIRRRLKPWRMLLFAVVPFTTFLSGASPTVTLREIGQVTTGTDVLLQADVEGQIPALGQQPFRARQAVNLPFETDLDRRSPIPPDIVSAMGKLTIYKMQERTMADIEMGQPRQLSGVVVDPAGKPIVAAQVAMADVYSCGSRPAHMRAEVARDILRTKTNAKGRFFFSAMPESSEAYLTVDAPGYSVFRSAHHLKWPDNKYVVPRDDVRITLDPAATISKTPKHHYISSVGGWVKPKVNGQAIRGPVRLKNMDIIKVGTVILQYVSGNQG